MENIIGLKDLRENLPAYEKKVRSGMSFLVMKKSKPVFRLCPVDSEDEELWEEVIDFTKIKKGGVPVDELLKYL